MHKRGKKVMYFGDIENMHSLLFQGFSLNLGNWLKIKFQKFISYFLEDGEYCLT
jgi:hypothetical protein